MFLNINHLLEKNTETEQYTKYARLRKSTNPYLHKAYVRFNWKDILLLLEVLPWLSPRWLVLQNKLYSFSLSRNPENSFARQFTWNENVIYCISLWELFLFKEKVPSPSWPCSFYQNILTPGPGDVLRNWFFFSNATTLQSRLSDSSKQRIQEKSFLLSVLQ